MIGFHSKMELYLINANFWNLTHIKKIKQPKGLLLLNSELKRVLILVRQFFTGTSTQQLIIKYLKS